MRETERDGHVVFEYCPKIQTLSFEGLKLGNQVGCGKVGLLVGGGVGCRVGFTVGSLVGKNVGFKLGSFVGACVGSTLGIIVAFFSRQYKL